MITDIQREWLQAIKEGKIKKSDNPRKYSAYMNRIQKHINHALENSVWLAQNFVEILKDEETEINDESLPRYRRFKIILFIAKCLDPTLTVDPSATELPALVKLMARMFPKYTFELVRKDIPNKKE